MFNSFSLSFYLDLQNYQPKIRRIDSVFDAYYVENILSIITKKNDAID